MSQKQILEAIQTVTRRFDVITKRNGSLNVRVTSGLKTKVEDILEPIMAPHWEWLVTENFPAGAKQGIFKPEESLV